MAGAIPKRSLVTGGAGFIGSHVVDALVARGDRVEVIDDLSSGSRRNLESAISEGAHLRVGSLTDPELVGTVVEDFAPERVFHLAAQADVRKAIGDPGHDATVNILGTINLLEATRRAGSPPLIYAATGGAVYGEGEGQDLPLDESSEAAPEAPYGASKLAGEIYVALYRRLHRMPGTAVRFSNVYGPRQDPHGEAGVVAIFCGRLLDGESPIIFGDGRQTRDYVYVADVVEAMLAAERVLAERGVGLEGPFNIGTGLESSVLDLLDHLRKGVGGRVEPEHRDARAGEVSRISIDPALAERELGWRATTPLGDGLAQTLEWVRAQRER